MDEVLKNFSILFADDEKEIRVNFSNFLETFFDKVYCAKDGLEALEIYETYKPDAVILDINMPEIDGLDVAKKIRLNDTQTPIILLTAHTEKDKLFRAIELNLLKYIVKPIDRRGSREILELLSDKLSKNLSSIIKLNNGLQWDKKEKILLNENSNEIKLRQKEKALLEILINKKNTNVSFEEIFCHIWPDELPEYNMSNRIKTIAKDLRKKLPPETIKSIYGYGFKL